MNNHFTNGGKTMDITNDGQLALDRLLASLAMETDMIDKHSAHINNNNNNSNCSSPLSNYNRKSSSPNNIFTYPTIRDSNHNGINGVHTNLNDVIANLTDFTRTESIRQMSLTNGGGNSPNGNRYSFDQPPANNHIKRLASESENSSSISPSLSERSNGVSWSDQVQFIVLIYNGDKFIQCISRSTQNSHKQKYSKKFFLILYQFCIYPFIACLMFTNYATSIN